MELQVPLILSFLFIFFSCSNNVSKKDSQKEIRPLTLREKTLKRYRMMREQKKAPPRVYYRPKKVVIKKVPKQKKGELKDTIIMRQKADYFCIKNNKLQFINNITCLEAKEFALQSCIEKDINSYKCFISEISKWKQ